MTNQLASAAEAAPPTLAAQTNRTLADQIREDIVEGRYLVGDRLVVADLARRYGSSSNPVREALHQLQGEGIVIIPPNRGARVRSLGEDFVRNVYELRAVIEPYMVRWFVENATEAEIADMDALCGAIETMQGDFARYRDLNERFHGIVYARHYNTEATGLEFRQREVLFMLNRRYELTRARWRAILAEHRGLLEAVKDHDADAAAHITEQHVRGACEHLIQHMRAERSR
jgi:DNA-binding GntR family transcriptional regulator